MPLQSDRPGAKAATINGALCKANHKNDDLLAAQDGSQNIKTWQLAGVWDSKVISRLPVAFNMSALARSTDVSRQAVRLIVRELAAAGLVGVATDPRNAKAHTVVLTALGRT